MNRIYTNSASSNQLHDENEKPDSKPTEIGLDTVTKITNFARENS